MKTLLRISRVIDAVNRRFGQIASWCVLIACVVSAGNAMSRYGFSVSSNAWLEIQWYLFGIMVMFGAPYTLNVNEHVRVDIVYNNVSRRAQIWIDLLGTVLFLLPMALLLCWLSWPFFVTSYLDSEASGDAGGLLRWPIKFILPLGFLLLLLQGLSELIKRIGALTGQYELTHKYVHLQ